MGLVVIVVKISSQKEKLQPKLTSRINSSLIYSFIVLNDMYKLVWATLINEHII